MSITVTWTPVKNTERTAVRKHGKQWTVWRREGSRTLITSPDGDDLRWIEQDQIVELEMVE